MENTRSKNRRNKSHFKQKPEPNLDDIGDPEIPLLSSVDRGKTEHLATTPVAPGGNIVDMQGSLDQGTVEKTEEKKNDTKDNNKKDLNEKSETTKQEDDSEVKKKIEDITDITDTTECKESNDETEKSTNVSIEKEQVPQENNKSIETEETDEKNQTKEALSVKQGTLIITTIAF